MDVPLNPCYVFFMIDADADGQAAFSLPAVYGENAV